MEFRLPFNSAKPPFYVSLNDQRYLETWEGPYGTHDVDFNWGSDWGNTTLDFTDNKDAMNAVEVLYLKDIPKRNIASEGSGIGQFWPTNSRVQIQQRITNYGFLNPSLNNKIELGIRECDINHRPWDGLTIKVTGYITYELIYPIELYIYDVVFEIILAKDDFKTTPIIPIETRPEGLGYDPDKRVYWFLIDGPEVPSGSLWAYYSIQEIVSVTPASAFEPPTP
jgi:hypothetical protein